MADVGDEIRAHVLGLPGRGQIVEHDQRLGLVRAVGQTHRSHPHKVGRRDGARQSHLRIATFRRVQDLLQGLEDIGVPNREGYVAADQLARKDRAGGRVGGDDLASGVDNDDRVSQSFQNVLHASNYCHGAGSPSLRTTGCLTPRAVIG